MKNLTARQRQVLDFISEEVVNKNYPPSVREICQAMNLKSSSTVHAHLKALEKKGYIKRDPTKPRALEIMESKYHSTRPRVRSKVVPLVGQVTAGAPILAEENIESYHVVPEEMVRGEQVFLLKVKGDSMIGAGILDGDMVLVRQQPAAENGEIVVALLEDEATVKRFYREEDHVKLQAENPGYSPILSSDVRILGKVTGLIRSLA